MLRNYLLTAYKVFMRRKLFTAINLMCIVLTLVVLMVITTLLENAFFPTSGPEAKSGRFLQIMTMRSRSPNNESIRNSPLGYKLIEKYLKPLPGLEAVAAVTQPRAVSVYQGGRVTELQMRRADADYWKVLDFTVLAGRLPTLEDEQRGRFVAVINRSSGTRLFGGLPQGQLGRKVSVSGQTMEIIGVVEDTMHINAYADIWAPITTYPSSDYRRLLSGDFVALLLAKKASDLPQLRAEIKAIAASVEFDDPAEWERAFFWADSKLDLFARMTVGGLETENSGAATLLAIIVAAMLLFMLLPALNLINLNTGRILERSSEIGVRKAFGATSAQLVGQLIVENVLLCLAGGVIGVICAQGALIWLEGSGLIPYLKVSMNFAVLGYGLLITLVFGLLSGVLPAWKMSRLDPVHALKGTV